MESPAWASAGFLHHTTLPSLCISLVSFGVILWDYVNLLSFIQIPPLVSASLHSLIHYYCYDRQMIFFPKHVAHFLARTLIKRSFLFPSSFYIDSWSIKWDKSILIPSLCKIEIGAASLSWIVHPWLHPHDSLSTSSLFGVTKGSRFIPYFLFLRPDSGV